MIQTIGKQNKMAAILFLARWKAELQNVQYSNVFGIPMFGIQAPTLPLCFNALCSGKVSQSTLKDLTMRRSLVSLSGLLNAVTKVVTGCRRKCLICNINQQGLRLSEHMKICDSVCGKLPKWRPKQFGDLSQNLRCLVCRQQFWERVVNVTNSQSY